MNTITRTFKEVGLLSLVALLLLGANYTFGQWSNPPASPPNSNVAAPINVSGTTQVKAGRLTTSRFFVTSTYPVIELVEDEGEGDITSARIVNNNSILYLQANEGTIAIPDWKTGLRLNSASASGGKYALFPSEVRAQKYCDEDGNNCATAAEISGVVGGGSVINTVVSSCRICMGWASGNRSTPTNYTCQPFNGGWAKGLFNDRNGSGDSLLTRVVCN